jgi:hypothetical protein
MKQPAGLRKLSKTGTERLESVADKSDGHFMGLDIHAHIKAFREFANSEPTSVEGYPKIQLNIPVQG